MPRAVCTRHTRKQRWRRLAPPSVGLLISQLETQPSTRRYTTHQTCTHTTPYYNCHASRGRELAHRTSRTARCALIRPQICTYLHPHASRLAAGRRDFPSLCPGGWVGWWLCVSVVCARAAGINFNSICLITGQFPRTVCAARCKRVESALAGSTAIAHDALVRYCK